MKDIFSQSQKTFSLPLLFSALSLAAGLLIGGCIVEEQCSGDAECGAGQICIDRSCQSGCRLSRDCPSGQLCVGNQCQEEPSPDADADIDEDSEPDPEIECQEDMVPILNSYCIDIYEASRESATESSAGSGDTSPATSRAGVLPWTNMTREVAAAACERAGKRLCTHREWIESCEGPAGTDYPYGDVYEPETCNGIDTYGRGFQHLMPTGSFEGCVNDYGVYDMSGNVWEIDQDVPGWVHGGAYNCIDSQSLHICGYNQDFGTAPKTNVGFRCCSDGE